MKLFLLSVSSLSSDTASGRLVNEIEMRLYDLHNKTLSLHFVLCLYLLDCQVVMRVIN